MKRYGIKIFGIFLLLTLGLSPLLDSIRAQETAKAYLTLTASASSFNNYRRGNLDDWWAEKVGSGEQVDDGSPAFFALEAGMSLPLTSDAFRMGVTTGFIMPAEHSIWGSKVVYGYTLVLKPHIISIGLPLTFKLMDVDGLYARVNPALLLGWVTGYYWGPSHDYDFVLSPGIGFGLAGSVQYFFNDLVGVDLTFGLRKVKGGLSIDDPESSTGTSIFLLENGDEVHVDLSGCYLTIGVVGRLPVFKMQLPK